MNVSIWKIQSTRRRIELAIRPTDRTMSFTTLSDFLFIKQRFQCLAKERHSMLGLISHVSFYSLTQEN